MNEISDIIRSRRLSLGLTLEEVGNYVGVGKSTVKKWEDGFISNMRRDKIALLSEVLKVSPLTFIYGEITPDSTNTTVPNKEKLELTSHEKQLITAYRSHPEMQPAVDTILGLAHEAKKENLA